jgi:hypothetical protein
MGEIYRRVKGNIVCHTFGNFRKIIKTLKGVRAMNQKPQAEYLTIKQLAERLGMSVLSARYLARSKRLRAIKGAVINVNMSEGKYEILKINIHDAVRVYDTTI